MRKIIKSESSQDGKFRITIFSDNTVKRERLCTARVISIDENSIYKYDHGIEYCIATVEADFGDGRKATGPAFLWQHILFEKGLGSNRIIEGATVGLAILIKSENAGEAVIELWSNEQIEQLQRNNPIEENNTDLEVNEEIPNQEELTYQDEYDFDDMVEFYDQKKLLLKTNLIATIEDSPIYRQEPSTTRDVELMRIIFHYSGNLRFGFLNDGNFEFEFLSENYINKEKYIEETCTKFIEELQEYFLLT